MALNLISVSLKSKCKKKHWLIWIALYDKQETTVLKDIRYVIRV